MQAVLTLSQALNMAVTRLGQLAAMLLFAIMTVILLDVVFRGLGPLNSIKLQELAWHFNGGLFMAALGWAYVSGTHVRIEVISQRYTPRTRAVLELLGVALLLLPYVVAVQLYAFDYVAVSFAEGETSASPSGLGARWLIKASIVFGFATLGLAGLARIGECTVYLFGPHDNRKAVEHRFTLPGAALS